MKTTVNNVVRWGYQKGIIKKENIHAQTVKVFEEGGEIASAVLKKDMVKLKDSIGDTMVTLILLAEQHNMDVEDCLKEAWGVIKGRQGIMVDGSFIKNEDAMKMAGKE
jgi:NTP pyrophosphatase (non-canonical NTP hydrolase)